MVETPCQARKRRTERQKETREEGKGNSLRLLTWMANGKAPWRPCYSSSKPIGTDYLAQLQHEPNLMFRITGKEEMVDLYQEEAEVFKEKNYNYKERVLNCLSLSL